MKKILWFVLLPKILWFVLLPMGVVGVGLTVLVMVTEHSTAPSDPWDTTYSCPMRITVDGRIQDADRGIRRPWIVFTSDAFDTGARVDVGRSRGEEPLGASGGACALEITRLPGPDLEGTDWRIGHVDKRGARYAGARARVFMSLKADRDIDLSSGAFYAYDGVNVPGISVLKLDTEWREMVLDFQVSPDATTFEVWFRLAIHGTVSAKGTIYLSDVRVNLTGP